jgi:hypothetical protein
MPQSSLQNVKATIDAIVDQQRFSENRLYSALGDVLSWEPVITLSKYLSGFLNVREIDLVHRRLIRAIYLIELVNRDITSTKYETRWTDRLSPTDPRRTDFAECLDIHASICNSIVSMDNKQDLQEELKLVIKWGNSPHEFPVDYLSKTKSRIHTLNNLDFFVDPHYIRLLKLRQALLDPTLNPDHQIFAQILDKVRVKSYLTDRAQTGSYQTNREKRWEAHPLSPQFALRRDCLFVELALIEQLVSFQHFPQGLIDYLIHIGSIQQPSKVARCPITLDPLSFDVLVNEVTDPTHGKSAFQVGHLNPLKAGASDEFRHNPQNISWVSEDGNRIQGRLTLQETRDLLIRISKNYEILVKKGEI